MRRLKILFGSAILIFLSSIIIASKATDEEKNLTRIENNQLVAVNKNVDKKALKLYLERQQQLKFEIQAYFERAIAKGDIVGAGVSIVQGDSIILSDGFGKRSVDGTKNVDGETVFRLGSLSKGFTGVLAASLQSENVLDFNDRVTEYLPQFQLGTEANTQKITLAHILSHSAGTPYHSYTNLVEAGLPMTEIASRFHEVTPISEPGSTYSYQNALFALSQEAMKEATGDNFTTLLKKRFFIPLEMKNVSMDYNTLSKASNVALPHSKRRNGWRKLRLNDHYYNAVAAGGINASSSDMAKWMRFLLGHNPEVFSQSAIQEAFCPTVSISYNRKYYQKWPGHVRSQYGFGWRIHTVKEKETGTEKTIWHHGGSVNNYRNEIALYPEEDLGICVLLNSNSKIARHVIPDLYALMQEVFADTPESIL
ncbi:serine hydrolase domain-containing protein [Allomuricauda sp. d1]|uniref:serine hydrolase domain-containing protein n=1 Tax=Allomuricauda sp. d1 TaxID=3136725 RepID=UPI0031D0C68E